MKHVDYRIAWPFLTAHEKLTGEALLIFAGGLILGALFEYFVRWRLYERQGGRMDTVYEEGYGDGQAALAETARRHLEVDSRPPAELAAVAALEPTAVYPPDTGPVPVVNKNNPAFWYPENVHALRERLRILERGEAAAHADPDTWLHDELAKLYDWSAEQHARMRRAHYRILAQVPREAGQSPLFEVTASR